MATTNPKATTGATRAITFNKASQESLIKYMMECVRGMSSTSNMRNRLLEMDKLYQRETDLTAAQRRARAANRAGDASKIQDVVIPVVQPQVESILSFLSNIFLSSYPLFPVLSKPQMMDAALQMEAVIGEQGIRFGWAAELMQVLRDAVKYNICACEVDWVEQKTYSVQNDAMQDVKNGVKVETVYEGNSIKRRDPYNVIYDLRVPPFEMHTRGEYCGFTELIGRIELKRRFAELDPTLTMNAREAFESGDATYASVTGSDAFYVPQVNSDALLDPSTLDGQTNWMAWGGLETQNTIKYSNMYEWTVLYARILPSEHGIGGPAPQTPQIFKLIYINRKVLVYAQRMTNAHDYLPMIIAQALEDGLGWQTKSFTDNIAPYQTIASGLFKSGMESQRRKVYDRIFYDPSRIAKADIDNTSVVARVPIKSEAYGKPITEAFAVVPYRDDNVNLTFDTAMRVTEMSDVVSGQNRVQRGQFQKGNKTRTEFNETMDASNSRPMMTAQLLEVRLFQPIKHILKINTLQYQPPVNLFDRKTKEEISVDPVQLRKTAPEFKLADGLMPSSKLVNIDTFTQLFNAAASAPQMNAEFDITGAFVYWLQLQGATWIGDFKRTPEQAAAMMQPQAAQPAGAPALPPV
jgi:hypothetical protein